MDLRPLNVPSFKNVAGQVYITPLRQVTLPTAIFILQSPLKADMRTLGETI